VLQCRFTSGISRTALCRPPGQISAGPPDRSDEFVAEWLKVFVCVYLYVSIYINIHAYMLTRWVAPGAFCICIYICIYMHM